MGLIPEDVIRQVLDRADIVEVISAALTLKQTGRNFKAPCPFHNEKTPSFVVNPDKQIFHCFGCGAGGNVVSFLMQQDHLSFPEAIRVLAEKYGIPIPEEPGRATAVNDQRRQLQDINERASQYFHQILLGSRQPGVQAARQYLKDRGLDLAIVKSYQLGFAIDQWDGLIQHFRTSQDVGLPLLNKAGLIIARQNHDGYYDRYRNRIIFPIFDVKGRCVAFGGRTMESDNPAKYLNSPETPLYVKGQHLYGLNWAREGIAREDCAVVVEGYLDFIVPFAAGVTNVVASLGTALTVEQIRLLRRFTRNIVLLFDSDQAGESAMVRSLDPLISEGMQARIASLAAGEDPDSYIRRFGVEAFRERLRVAEPVLDFKLRILIERFGLGTIAGRARISEEMFPTINRVPNEIIKAEYVKKLAQALSVSLEALRMEMAKGASGTPRPAPVIPAGPETDPLRGIRPVERDILRLLLQDGELLGATRKLISLEDFHNEQVRVIVEKVFAIFDQKQQVSFTDLMSSCHDPQALRIISGLTADEHALPGDKKRMLRDCLARLEQERLKKTRQDLRRQMAEAQRMGDAQRMAELTRQFNHSIKRSMDDEQGIKN